MRTKIKMLTESYHLGLDLPYIIDYKSTYACYMSYDMQKYTTTKIDNCQVYLYAYMLPPT